MHPDLASLAARLKYARKHVGLTQAELAAKSGMKQTDVSKIENGIIQRTTGLIGLSSALGVRPEWLDSGAGEPWTDTGSNLGPEPLAAALVPLISFVQAGAWCDAVDSLQPGDAYEWLPCPVKHGQNTYCLTVEGESMYDPLGRHTYSPGDIIFVDPSRDAKHGDRVVVRLDDQQTATFKQLVEEDGRRMLKALNPDWKPRYVEITGSATICGVVIGKLVRE